MKKVLQQLSRMLLKLLPGAVYVLLVKNFLGNNKADNYEELVKKMLTHFRNLVTYEHKGTLPP